MEQCIQLFGIIIQAGHANAGRDCQRTFAGEDGCFANNGAQSFGHLVRQGGELHAGPWQICLPEAFGFCGGVLHALQTLQDANAMREDNNKTILMYACWVGNADAVTYLIAKGADVNAQDAGGASPLHLAAWKGHTAIALHLLEHGASGQSMSNEGMTPLDIAMMQGNKEIAEAIEKAAPKLKPLLKR